MKTHHKQISLLPEFDFTPKFPSENTLAARALHLMLKGKKISHPDFESTTSSWRLAAHIHILKKLNWDIQTIEVNHCAAYKPKNRRICRYFLRKEFIRKLKGISGVRDYDIKK